MAKIHIRNIQTSDSQGAVTTVIEERDEIVTQTLCSSDRLPGITSFRLGNGSPVNKISDAEYFDVLGDRTLHAV